MPFLALFASSKINSNFFCQTNKRTKETRVSQHSKLTTPPHQYILWQEGGLFDIMNVRRLDMIMMGVPQTATSPPPRLYPEELQLKLYQAFIFSIPILFSIILFLLFYLFYLKRRASLSTSSRHLLPRTNPPTTYRYHSSPCRLDLTAQFLDKLSRILFDEDLQARDSLCCVCLGEFEMKEEVLQIPYCKHVFHIDCIHHWLQSNSTCPLCRCSIIPTTKFLNPPPPINIDTISSDPPQQGAIISDSPLQIIPSSMPPHLEDQAAGASSNITRE